MSSKSYQREQRRRKGLANYRLVRYADDWVVLVAGTQADAEQLRDETAVVLVPMGLRLSEEKTRIVHIDQGFDFLGMHIQRHKQLALRSASCTPTRREPLSQRSRQRYVLRHADRQTAFGER
jgi:hypothetical protein